MELKPKNIVLILVTALVALGLAAAAGVRPRMSAERGNRPIATVVYSCDSGRTIRAALYEGESRPPARPGEPPVPGGSAAITLSDGRTMTLPRTLSADGLRYANADESVIFWSKGTGAFVMERNVMTYANCVEE